MGNFQRIPLIALATLLSGALSCFGANAQTVTIEQFQHPKMLSEI